MRSLSILLVAAVIPGCVGGGITASYWTPDLSADFQIPGGGSAGDLVNLQDDLDVEDEGSVPVERIWAQFGANRCEFGRWDLSVSGDVTVSTAFDFDGQTYGAGDLVDTTFDVEVWRLAYLFCPKLGKFKAGAGLALQWWDVEAVLDDAALPVPGEYDEQYPIPALTARLEIPFNRFVLAFGEADWMDMDLEGVDSSLLDFRAGLRFSAAEVVAIVVGYRRMRAEVDVDDDYTDLDFGGLTITIETWW